MGRVLRTHGGGRGRQEKTRARTASRAGVAAGPEPGRGHARLGGDGLGAAGAGTGQRRSVAAEEGPVLRLPMPDGRVESDAASKTPSAASRTGDPPPRA